MVVPTISWLGLAPCVSRRGIRRRKVVSLSVMAERVPISANLVAPVAFPSWWVPGTSPGTGSGPPSTPSADISTARRGCRAFARHDVVATAKLPVRYVSAYGACPGHPPPAVAAQMAGTAPGHDGEATGPAPNPFSIRRFILIAMGPSLAMTRWERPPRGSTSRLRKNPRTTAVS